MAFQHLSELAKKDIKKKNKEIDFINNVSPPQEEGIEVNKFVNNNAPIKITVPNSKNVRAEELEIKLFDKNVNNIVNRSVIFYGTSGTGKTFYIRDLMFLMRDMFTKVFVFSPTNEDKHDFNDLVPNLLIYETFTAKDIKKIYESQQAAASVYNKANKIDILEGIFEKIASRDEDEYLKGMEERYAKKFGELTDEEAKNGRKEFIKDMYLETKIKYLKKIIQQSHYKPENDDEKYCVTYMNFNPKILVIFDDAINELKAIIKTKKEGDVVKDFFFKGRHAKITHFYAFQDETNIDTSIKKNAFVSIFTDPNVARGFFSKASSNFGAQDKARAAAAVDAIFPLSESDTEKKNNKLLYARMDKNKFQYTRAADHPKFKMCSKYVWKFCLSVEKKDDDNKDNPYLAGFKKNM